MGLTALPQSPDLYLRSLLLRGGREKKGKREGSEGDRRWREGFGPPINFGVAPLCFVPFNDYKQGHLRNVCTMVDRFALCHKNYA